MVGEMDELPDEQEIDLCLLPRYDECNTGRLARPIWSSEGGDGERQLPMDGTVPFLFAVDA